MIGADKKEVDAKLGEVIDHLRAALCNWISTNEYSG